MSQPPAPVRVDLRLASAALTGWVLAAAALWSPTALTVAAIIGWVAVLLAGLVLIRLRPGPMPQLGVLVAAGALLVLVPLLPRLVSAREGPVAALADSGATVTLELTVQDDPRAIAAGPGGGHRIACEAAVRELVRGGAGEGLAPGGLGGRLLVIGPAQGWAGALPGQRVRATGKLLPAQHGKLLSAVLVTTDSPIRLGGPPIWQRGASSVRRALHDAVSALPPGPRGLLPGLVVGDTSELDPVLQQRFRDAGMTHLVAVSGTNCAIVVGAVLLLLRRARASPRWCAALALVALVGFVVLARPSPSVLRAAVMAAVALLALALGRERSAIPILSAAVLALLIWHPAWALDAGFAMSVLATGALLLIAPGWATGLRARRVPPFVAESLAVSSAATLATLPVVVAISGRMSLVCVPANMLAEPAVAPATILGLAVALLAPWQLTAAGAVAQLAGLPARWLVRVAEVFGGAEGAVIPWPAGFCGAALVLICAGAAVLVIRRRGWAPVLVALLVALVVQMPLRAVTSAWPASGWIMVACDVGQGDGLVLAAGPGSAVVVDAGPDPVAMDRCLADLGVRDVPLLILTHLHADHVAGVAGVFHRRSVAAIATGPLWEPSSGLADVLGALATAGLGRDDLTVARPGESLDIGPLRLEVLAPPRALHGTRSDPNNSSLIVRAATGGVRILLSGDSEVEEQYAALDAGIDLSADVLKIPHHGSAHTEQQFLSAVGARLGVISVGLDNSYGLPAPLLLSMLPKAGISAVARTDQAGDIAIVAESGGNLRLVSRGHPMVVASGPARGSITLLATGASSGFPSRARGTIAPWPGTREQAGARAAPESSSCTAMRNCSSRARSPPRCTPRARRTQTPTCPNSPRPA